MPSRQLLPFLRFHIYRETKRNAHISPGPYIPPGHPTSQFLKSRMGASGSGLSGPEGHFPSKAIEFHLECSEVREVGWRGDSQVSPNP